MATAKTPAKKPVSVAKDVLAGKGYTKAQLQSALAEIVSAEGVEVTKKEAGAVVDALVKVLITTAKKNEKGATLPGLGKLVLRKTKARMGRNPQTGEPVKIKANKKLAFRIAKAAKVEAGIIKAD
ncbi:MAG: HU family DNA-binding protein [Planctomycetota bacterium]|nr:MAG: HU family DNA-binding protein [Planctomycetota bacterium]